MCYAWVPQAIMAVGAVYSGYSSYQQGQFQQKVSEYNARQFENEAIQTRNKGVEEENKHREKIHQLIAQQRTQAAGAGVDVDSGSALWLQEDAAVVGEADALRIRRNFGDRADMLDDRATLTLAEGHAARQQGRNQLAASTIGALGEFTGGQGFGNLAKSWFSSDSAAAQGLNNA